MVQQITSSSLGGVLHYQGDLGSMPCGGVSSRKSEYASRCQTPAKKPSCGTNCDGWKKKGGDLRFRLKQAVSSTATGAAAATTAAGARIMAATSTTSGDMRKLTHQVVAVLRKVVSYIVSIDYRGGYKSAANWAHGQSKTVRAILASLVGAIVLLLVNMFL
jgi:hypothetical protein